MICVATQEETIDIISERLQMLKESVKRRDAEAISKIDTLFRKATREIESDGLTQETCNKISVLMISNEKKFKDQSDKGDTESTRLWAALLLLHQSMTLLLPEGMNEGSKDCCPWCEGC